MQTETVRAWKNPGLLATRQLATNPVGEIDLSDTELKEASGLGIQAMALTTAMTCTETSFRGWKSCCP
jgi:mersacidin/lichenicidin family type 2 lantibiotic